MMNALKFLLNIWRTWNRFCKSSKQSGCSCARVSAAEICKSNQAVDCHHLQYQSVSNENGYINNDHTLYNKNHEANLCAVCKSCHDKMLQVLISARTDMRLWHEEQQQTYQYFLSYL